MLEENQELYTQTQTIEDVRLRTVWDIHVQVHMTFPKKPIMAMMHIPKVKGHSSCPNKKQTLIVKKQ